jgi:hypothetical protein
MVETLGRGLVEVVRDPGCDSYQLLVEMRHDAGDGRFGLYFGYREDSPPPGVRQGSYFTLTFAENLFGKVDVDGEGNPLGWVMLEVVCFVEDAQDPKHPTRWIARPMPFRLARRPGNPGSWRTLVVEVRPTGVEARWAAEDRTLTTAGKGSAQELTEHLGIHRMVNHLPDAIPTEFRPRSGLGLYVHGGRASVRRLVLTPLPDGGAPAR